MTTFLYDKDMGVADCPITMVKLTFPNIFIEILQLWLFGTFKIILFLGKLFRLNYNTIYAYKSRYVRIEKTIKGFD